VAEFSACNALSAGSPWCLHNLGRAWSEAGQQELAVGYYDRALKLDPNLGASYLGRATVYLKKDRAGDALDELRRAADAGIPAAEIDYRKGVVYLSRGDRTAAIACLKSCLAHEPRHLQAQEALTRATENR
jgi:tetratricopeptide (TPR) repeat protein